jgi:hypothetical protein
MLGVLQIAGVYDQANARQLESLGVKESLLVEAAYITYRDMPFKAGGDQRDQGGGARRAEKH